MSNRPRSTARRKPVPVPVQSTPAPIAAAADFAASIGRVARRIREDLGLTLASVAQQAGISPGMLSRLETGQVSPSRETIVALAEVLGVRPAISKADATEVLDRGANARELGHDQAEVGDHQTDHCERRQT